MNTPRTDAEQKKLWSTDGQKFVADYYVTADFSRKLELELYELQDRLLRLTGTNWEVLKAKLAELDKQQP